MKCVHINNKNALLSNCVSSFAYLSVNGGLK